MDSFRSGIATCTVETSYSGLFFCFWSLLVCFSMLLLHCLLGVFGFVCLFFKIRVVHSLSQSGLKFEHRHEMTMITTQMYR